jgi:hypothetical protein
MSSDVDEKVLELVESWICGNRKDVMRAIGNMSGMRAAYTAALMALRLECTQERAATFLSMMKGRIK